MMKKHIIRMQRYPRNNNKIVIILTDRIYKHTFFPLKYLGWVSVSFAAGAVLFFEAAAASAWTLCPCKGVNFGRFLQMRCKESIANVSFLFFLVRRLIFTAFLPSILGRHVNHWCEQKKTGLCLEIGHSVSE